MLWKSFLSFSKVRAGSRKAARWTQHSQHPLRAPKQVHGTGCCLGKEPQLKEQDFKHKVCFTPGHCTPTGSIRGTPVFPVFPQTNWQRKQWLHTCQWCSQGFHSQLHLHSLRDIPVPQKALSRPACGPRCLEAQPLHKAAPHALVALLLPWWLCSCVLPHLPRHLHV